MKRTINVEVSLSGIDVDCSPLFCQGDRNTHFISIHFLEDVELTGYTLEAYYLPPYPSTTPYVDSFSNPTMDMVIPIPNKLLERNGVVTVELALSKGKDMITVNEPFCFQVEKTINSTFVNAYPEGNLKETIDEKIAKIKELLAKTDEKIKEYNDNAEQKTLEFNENSAQKTVNFDNNASDKTDAYNLNATNKKNEYDNNAKTKLDAYNANDKQKTDAYNENDRVKTEAYNANDLAKTTAFNNNAINKTKEFDNNALSKTTDFNNNSKTKKDEYIELIQDEGTKQVRLVTKSGEKALSDIGTTSSAELQKITNAGTTAVNDINSNKTTALGMITDEGAKQVKAVTDAGNTKVQAITNEGNKQVGLVTSEGTKQVGLVTAEGNKQIKAVADELIKVVDTAKSIVTSGAYKGDFPLTKANLNDVYFYKGDNKYYICVIPYSGESLAKPDNHFEELSIFTNRRKIEELNRDYIKQLSHNFRGLTSTLNINSSSPELEFLFSNFNKDKLEIDKIKIISSHTFGQPSPALSQDTLKVK